MHAAHPTKDLKHSLTVPERKSEKEATYGSSKREKRPNAGTAVPFDIFRPSVLCASLSPSLSLSSASAVRPARPVPEAVYGLIMAVLGEEKVAGTSWKPFQRVIIAISLAPRFLLVQRDGEEDKERKTDREDGWKEGGHKREREDEDRGDY